MANDESLALEPDLASPDSLPSELADSMASPDENALVLDAPPEAIPPPNALALDAPSEAVLSPEALNQKAVQALAEANLNWVRQTQNIWDDHDDTPEIHALIRAKFNRRLIALKKSRATSSWPGLVIIGNPGAGKTHLLGSFYRQTLAKKGFFLVVDMIGVNAFFDTVVEHLLNSLAAPDPDGRTQALRLAENILTISLDPGQTLPANFDEWLASAPFEKLCQIISSTIKRLHLRSGIQNLANRFGDIIRALFFFCSKSQTISNYGRLWLQGLLDRQNQTLDKLRFSGQRLSPDIVVQGLTWLMSLNGSFSVLAIDQLDALIKLHAITLNAASAGDNSGFLAANRVLNEVSAGLGTLINITYKSTTVLSLLQDTWQSLLKFGLTPAIQRYNAPWFLNKIEKGEHMADLLAKRLAPSFLAHDLVPPYPSWPFALPALEEMAGRLDPRRLLIKCEKYLDNCLDNGQIEECLHLSDQDWSPPAEAIIDLNLPKDEPPKDAEPKDAEPLESERPSPAYRSKVKTPSAAEVFAQYCQMVDIELYKKEAHEETLWSAALEVLALCVCLEENMADWGEDEELIVATNYSPKNFPLTHATIQRSSPNLERVLNLRALLQTNHTAFQARLKGAITQAGLDSQLAARRLIIFRFDDYPKGQATSALTEKFADLGGILIQPKDEDLRKLGGLATTWQDKPRDLEAWLKRAKPTETIASLAEHIAWIKARP